MTGKSKSGLGTRGQDKAVLSSNELFRKTDNKELQNTVNTHHSSVAFGEDGEPVRKQFVLPYELSEKLRKCAFDERRKEVDIVRAALEEYLEKR